LLLCRRGVPSGVASPESLPNAILRGLVRLGRLQHAAAGPLMRALPEGGTWQVTVLGDSAINPTVTRCFVAN
jgi:hypothetical protein